MKSLECVLDASTKTTVEALKETECFAKLCMLSEKQGLHLRLLAEELLGMASSVLELSSGSFWVEQEDLHFQLHLVAQASVGENARNRLVDASSTGKNERHKGVTGKIRQAIDYLLDVPSSDVGLTMGMHGGMYGEMYGGMLSTASSMEWSLESYRKSVSKEEKAQAWDELEKSILGKLADEVRVGVRSSQVEITIVKAF